MKLKKLGALVLALCMLFSVNVYAAEKPAAYRLTIKNEAKGIADKNKEFAYIIMHNRIEDYTVVFDRSNPPNLFGELGFLECRHCWRCFVNNESWQAHGLETSRQGHYHSAFTIAYGQKLFSLKAGQSATFYVQEGDRYQIYPVYTSDAGEPDYKISYHIDGGSEIQIPSYDVSSSKGLDPVEPWMGEMPAKDSTIVFTNRGNDNVQEEKPLNPTDTTKGFRDVARSAWYAEAVDYVTRNGLMSGVGDSKFSPDGSLTRGMMAQVLYQLEGKPAVGGVGFVDVADSAWYAKAVRWAAAEGIVSGYGSGRFGPNDNVTREQMVSILQRYAQYKKYDTTASESLAKFADGESTSNWAKPAVQWAIAEDLFYAKTGGNLNAKGHAGRAEVAYGLMNFCENVIK